MSDFSQMCLTGYAEKLNFTLKKEMLKKLQSQHATETKFIIISFTLTAIRHHSNDILSHTAPSMNHDMLFTVKNPCDMSHEGQFVIAYLS